MNTREAIVINTLNGNQPVLDFDPIDLEIGIDGMAVGASDTLMTFFETVSDAESDLPISPLTVTYAFVWSDDFSPVRFVCAICDDVCNLDYADIEDLPDHTTAMVCATCLD